jgi:signal transduction histidine kinase
MGSKREKILKKLDAALEEVDDILYVDFERVLALARQAQASAAQIDAPEQLARALHAEAWVLVNRRHLEEAVEKALTALEYARAYRLPDVECRAIGVVAASFAFTRDLSNAVQLLEHQREIAEAANDASSLAMAAHDLGVMVLETGDIPRATELIEQGIATMPPDRYRGVVLGMMLTSLGIVYIKTERYEQALEIEQRALDIFLRAKSDYYAITAYHHLGYLFMMRKEFDRADSYLARAYEIGERRNYPEMQAATVGLIGELRWKEGRLTEALKLYAQAVSLAQQQDMFVYLVSFYDEMSQICQTLGDYPSALRYRDLQQKTSDSAAARNITRRLEILRSIFGANQSQQKKALEQLQKGREDERVKDSILERLSHEFRTPLTVIRSGTDLLERYYERLSDAQRKSQFEKINSRVTWMTIMLDEILMLLRLNRGEIGLHPHYSGLRETVEKALNKIELMVGGVQRVDLDLPPSSFWFDPDLLSVILIQLVSNALKFSKARVHLTLEIRDGELRLTVTDSGIGIPAEEIARVAEVFYRATNLDEQAGYGLGMALVDRAVTAYGGRWEIRSELMLGTTVTAHLPLLAPLRKPDVE